MAWSGGLSAPASKNGEKRKMKIVKSKTAIAIALFLVFLMLAPMTFIPSGQCTHASVANHHVRLVRCST